MKNHSVLPQCILTHISSAPGLARVAPHHPTSSSSSSKVQQSSRKTFPCCPGRSLPAKPFQRDFPMKHCDPGKTSRKTYWTCSLGSSRRGQPLPHISQPSCQAGLWFCFSFCVFCLHGLWRVTPRYLCSRVWATTETWEIPLRITFSSPCQKPLSVGAPVPVVPHHLNPCSYFKASDVGAVISVPRTGRCHKPVHRDTETPHDTVSPLQSAEQKPSTRSRIWHLRCQVKY